MNYRVVKRGKRFYVQCAWVKYVKLWFIKIPSIYWRDIPDVTDTGGEALFLTYDGYESKKEAFDKKKHCEKWKVLPEHEYVIE